MTQLELARTVKVSRDSIGRWERGDDVPSARMVVQISQALGVTMSYLVGISDAPQRAIKNDLAKELLDIFNRLSPTTQKALVETARDAEALEMMKISKPGRGGATSPSCS